MFSLRMRWGKASEQKIRDFKFLFKSKKAHKATSTTTRFDPKKVDT